MLALRQSISQLHPDDVNTQGILSSLSQNSGKSHLSVCCPRSDKMFPWTWQPPAPKPGVIQLHLLLPYSATCSPTQRLLRFPLWLLSLDLQRGTIVTAKLPRLSAVSTTSLPRSHGAPSPSALTPSPLPAYTTFSYVWVLLIYFLVLISPKRQPAPLLS